MAGPSPLLRLPPELQIQVAELVDSKSLLALRLVNTELAATTFDIFITQFFTFRRHVMTNHSLRVLRAIAATPELTRRLTDIEFVTIGTDLEYDEYNNMPGAYPVEEDSQLSWCRKVDDAFGWQDAGLLHDIFENLARIFGGMSARCNVSINHERKWRLMSEHLLLINHSESCYCSSADTIPWRTFGMATYRDSVRQWADSDRITSGSSLDRSKTVLQALFKANYRPRSLRLSLPRLEDLHPGASPEDMWLDQLSAEEEKGRKDFCSKLQRFDADLRQALVLSSTAKGLLASMTGLRFLVVSGADTTMLDDALPRLLSGGLETISLSCLFGPSQSLRSFLGRHATTCTNLRICGSYLFGQELRDVFHLISHSYIKLETLQIGRVMWMPDIDDVLNSTKSEVNLDGQVDCTIKGQDEIREAVAKLLLENSDAFGWKSD